MVPAKKVAKKATGVKKAPAKKAPARSSSPSPSSSPHAYRGPREPKLVEDVKGAVVDELPKVHRNGRTQRFASVMREVREEVGAGKWVQIATFVGNGGAGVARRAMLSGNRPIDGDVSEWDIAARKVDGGGSALFVRLRTSMELVEQQ